jgi:hypothetical protein
MEVYCDDFDVWDFYSGFSFRYSANWNWQFGNIDTKFLTPLNIGFGCISFGVGFERQVWGVLIGLLEAYF